MGQFLVVLAAIVGIAVSVVVAAHGWEATAVAAAYVADESADLAVYTEVKAEADAAQAEADAKEEAATVAAAKAFLAQEEAADAAKEAAWAAHVARVKNGADPDESAEIWATVLQVPHME